MLYVFTQHKSPSFVGKYTTMEQLKGAVQGTEETDRLRKERELLGALVEEEPGRRPWRFILFSGRQKVA